MKKSERRQVDFPLLIKRVIFYRMHVIQDTGYIKFHVLNFLNQFFAIIEIVYCLGNNAFDLWNMNRSLRQRI